MKKTVVFLFLFFAFWVYSFIVYTKGTTAKGLAMNAEAVQGKLLYEKYNCTACHQIYGLGGYIGPELTTMISQPGKGALYANALLKTGTLRMPNFHLKDTEINELIEYFKYVDETTAMNKK